MVRWHVCTLLIVVVVFPSGCKESNDGSKAVPQRPLVEELIAIVEADGDPAELAAGSLGNMGAEAKKAVPALTKSLNSSLPRTRIAAAIALFDIDSESEESMQKVVATLVRALTDEDDDVQREALRLLSRQKKANDEQVRAIARALVDNDDYVAAHATDALVKVGARSVPVLVEAAKNPKSVLWAVLALGDIGPDAKPAVATLVEASKDPDPLIRQESALALAKVQADAATAIPVLKALLDDKAPMVQAAAAYALVQFGPAAKEVAEQLRAMTRGGDPLSRIIGALALIDIDCPRGDEAKPLAEILQSGLDDPHPVARCESAKGLGKLGAAASAAKEKLATLADKDPDESVRKAADEAVHAISK